jgi:hypothetical protein
MIVLTEQRMGLAEAMRHDWVVNAQEGTTVKDILDPTYWAYVAPKMSIYDRVEVRLETGEWVAELLVLGLDRNWARVHMLQLYDLIPVAEAAPAPQSNEVFWRGPQHKWAVRRLADQEVIQQNFESKLAAAEWMRQHEQVVANT